MEKHQSVGLVCGASVREAILFYEHLYPVVSATIELPDDVETCAYCGSRIFEHDPICVRDCDDECGSPRFFCNYACLSADIDENDGVAGDACAWSPE